MSSTMDFLVWDLAVYGWAILVGLLMGMMWNERRLAARITRLERSYCLEDDSDVLLIRPKDLGDIETATTPKRANLNVAGRTDIRNVTEMGFGGSDRPGVAHKHDDIRELLFQGNVYGLTRLLESNRDGLDSVSLLPPEAVELAILGGSVPMVEHLLALGVRPGTPLTNGVLMVGPADQGNVTMVKWLRNPNTGDGVTEWHYDAFALAVHRNRHDVVKLMLDPNADGGPCPRYHMSNLSGLQNGSIVTIDIAMLEIFRDPAYGEVSQWGADVVALAAEYGRIDILEWLRDPATGGGVCPWGPSAYAKATPEAKAWLLDPLTGGGTCPQ